MLLNSLGFVDILYSKPKLSILGSRSNLAGILFVWVSVISVCFMLEERHPGISRLCADELFSNLCELFGFNIHKNFPLLLFKNDWWGAWREQGTLWFRSLQRSPPCPSLTYHEVQGKNRQPTVQWAQKPWQCWELEAGVGGRQYLLPSPLPSVRAGVRQHGWRGTPERALLACN